MHNEKEDTYPTGTRRKMCRHCHYELHTKKGRRKWVMKQRARITTLIVKPCGPHDPRDPQVPRRPGVMGVTGAA